MDSIAQATKFSTHFNADSRFRSPETLERLYLFPQALVVVDPEPCFASKRTEQEFYDQFWFSRVRDSSYQP
jgi:hypothetical protein